MKIYAPKYYRDFKCIADRCRHSCCINWDVYIDDDTLEKYNTLDGDTGDRIRSHLTEREDGVCFCMGSDGRCPFLNTNGLCDIIIEKGEGYLSEICSEHPRFYNFFSDRTEAGLGLSCEEAARIILSSNDTSLTVISEDTEEEWELTEIEEYILTKRQAVFGILSDDGITLDEKIDKILDITDCIFPKKSTREWAEILKGLERLEDGWNEALENLAVYGNYAPIPEFDKYFEDLLHYFIYRHTPSAESEHDFGAKIAFALLGYTVIKALCNAEIIKKGTCSFESLTEFARAYSAEIEYSEENTETLIHFFY